MSWLNHKIPPPVVFVVTAVLMWMTQQWMPYSSSLPKFLMQFAAVMGALWGIGIALLGLREFRKAKTTVNPLKPETSSTLVRSGIYEFSRNPMYLGMLLVLVAWGLWLGNPWALIWTLGFVMYINEYQIKPEEAALRKLFGDAFDQYTREVRRWI